LAKRSIVLRYLGPDLSNRGAQEASERGGDGHGAAGPLDVVEDVEGGVDDEGVHAAGVVAEARDAVAALLGGAELVLEEGVVFGADDGEVEGHGGRTVGGRWAGYREGIWIVDVRKRKESLVLSLMFFSLCSHRE
jgi:hypothetical protein